LRNKTILNWKKFYDSSRKPWQTIMENSTEEDQNIRPDLNDLITFSQAAEVSGFTTRHLRHLAMTGEIWAKKLGPNWVTTARAVQDYLALNKKPGPKPRK
jgi:hypothetical protein